MSLEKGNNLTDKSIKEKDAECCNNLKAGANRKEDSDANADGEEEAAKIIIPYLAARAYHLPGNDCCADWVQYILNNHPVLGICFHHKLHPVGKFMRMAAFFGSLAFGLGISCIVGLSMTYYIDPDSIVIEFDFNASTYVITRGMIVLWTVGSGLHSLYDLFVWRLAVCACFQPGGCYGSKACSSKCRGVGNYVVVFAVVFVTAITALAVLLRAALESADDHVDILDLDSGGILDDAIDLVGDIEKEQFSFVFTYLIEVALAQLYFPVTGTIMFSGVLGCCGRSSIFGGRPYEIRQEQTEAELKDILNEL